jgi:hypothetical protein
VLATLSCGPRDKVRVEPACVCSCGFLLRRWDKSRLWDERMIAPALYIFLRQKTVRRKAGVDETCEWTGFRTQ